jgi:thiosulfate reductase / polysulfide reductase chain A
MSHIAGRKVSRRGFLKLSGALAAGTAMAGSGVAGAASVTDRAPSKPAWRKRGPATVTQSICHECLWRCGVTVTAVGGRVVKIDGNPANPSNRGKMCARGQAGIMDLYDPDRLKTPLIRTGERGDGKYRQASWTEALDRAAEGLNKVKSQWGGPEVVAWFAHNGGDSFFAEYLPAAWGSPNAGKPSEAICTTPRERAYALTTGRAIGAHEPVDWENTRYVVLMGFHIGENAHVTHMTGLAEARARGAGLVVVDPRQSVAASKADRWLQIKPGTDTALLLAWMNVLITEGLYDKEYVAKWTIGLPALQAHVKDMTPEWAAGITGLPAESIRQVAREMAAASPNVVIPPGRFTVWYGNDAQRMRALYMLNALLGSIGRPGGLYISQSAYLEEYPHAPLPLAPAAGG